MDAADQHQAEEATGQAVGPASSIQRIINGNRVRQNSKAWFAHSTAPVTLLRRLHHVMMVVPVDRDVDEGEEIGGEERQHREHGGERRLLGIFSSSTMIVRTIATTPSVRAFSRSGSFLPRCSVRVPTRNRRRGAVNLGLRADPSDQLVELDSLLGCERAACRKSVFSGGLSSSSGGSG